MNGTKKTVRELISLFLEELRGDYPEQEIRAILYRLFDHHNGWSRATVQLNKATMLDGHTETLFLEELGRLKQGEPIQYIIGSTEFCGLLLKVRPGVLIPRPETEEMAVIVARENQHFRDLPIAILDMGTGSGCLALAMKRAFPAARVTGVDKFSHVIDLARENSLSNELDVTFQEGDMLFPDFLDLTGSFDIIVSNPPYVPVHERDRMSRHVADQEPADALFVPSSHPLIFYEAILSLALLRLSREGRLYVEIHEEQGDVIAGIFREAGLTSVEIIRDCFGKDRFIKTLAPYQ